jgi:hypothetical protein
MKQKILLFLFSLLLSYFNYRLLYQAQFLEYDDNWLLIACVFILSIFIGIVLILLFFLKRQWIVINKEIIAFYLVFNSPISIIAVVLFCIAVLEIHLK